MDLIGNLNEDIDPNVKVAKEVIGKSFTHIWNGLLAMKNIHDATNRLVIHNGKVLSEVLDQPDVLRTYVLATFVELAEFIQVLPWKPWRVSVKTVDKDKVLDEFADILAFIGVLMTILHDMGFSTYDIASAYVKKERINVSRFLERKENEHKI